MSYLAPLTLLAALISTAVFFMPATVRADQPPLQTAIALPLPDDRTAQPAVEPADDALTFENPDEQVVNDNLAFSYEYRPALQNMTRSNNPSGIEFISLPYIYFDHDGITLNSKAAGILDGAAQFVFENDTTVKRILINAHTSDIADRDYNYRLSDRRAYAVWDYLAAMGIPTALMLVTGWGETRPVDENWTRIGRQHNRRVEIQIVQQK